MTANGGNPVAVHSARTCLQELPVRIFYERTVWFAERQQRVRIIYFLWTTITYDLYVCCEFPNTCPVLRVFWLPVFVVLIRQWDVYCATIITVTHTRVARYHRRGRCCSRPPETAVFLLLLIFIQFCATRSESYGFVFSHSILNIFRRTQ